MKTAIVSIFAFLSISFQLLSQSLQVGELRCEYQLNPLGIDARTPRLSWKLSSPTRGVMQSAYEIRVSENGKKGNPIWESGKTISDQSVLVPYAGPALRSRARYSWQVRIWDNTGKASPWSVVNFWEMGLLGKTDWSAKWIQSNFTEEPSRPAHQLRAVFEITKPIARARLYVTARGLYEAHLNGIRVGKDYFTPGWTSYRTRQQYQTYDVTGMLKPGKNAVGMVLGNGWYRGYLAFEGNKNTYGDKLSLLAQLEITYQDGSTQRVISDADWKSSTGPIRMSEIYHGETYDARVEEKDWATSGYDDSKWSGVTPAENFTGSLIASSSPPVRQHEILKAARVFKTPKGETVVDFGQNLVGWIQLHVRGKQGDVVTIRHAEVLDKKGNFYTDNLRAAKAELTYTLKGGAMEIYEPHFTFFGFRYVQVEGYPGELRPEDISAITLYSDLATTGSFTCSNALVNQLQHNIQWGQKGNFLDVPTDCPQRDERLGWTGDAQAFSRTAAYNMEVAAFFSKWLRDLAADQNPDGAVPFVVPNVLGKNAVASAGWADAATIIPWTMYVAYGDKEILADQYESMKAWVNYMESKSHDYLWNTGFHFGDWLFFRPADDNDGRSAVTDKYLIAQAFFAHSTQLLVRAAEVLGKGDDARRYAELLGKIKAAFVHEYVTPGGRLVSGTQTADVLALQFDLLPQEWQTATADRLVGNIQSYDNHLTTGFLGTPYLCHVLSRFGHTDMAYTLLLQETYPSWLYPVKMGATTIWERWDGIKPDSTFQTPGMNSYNHYAYGAIGDWMYRVIAGLDTDPAAPGYKHARVAPQPGGGLTSASGTLETGYGILKSSWHIDGGMMKLEVTVPPNTTATIRLPRTGTKEVREQGAPLSAAKGIKTEGLKEGGLELTAGAGVYHFEYPWEK
jgi:alpha-L-rhamnosidase